MVLLVVAVAAEYDGLIFFAGIRRTVEVVIAAECFLWLSFVTSTKFFRISFLYNAGIRSSRCNGRVRVRVMRRV